MKEWYQMHEDEVLEALGSDANGLSSEKAEALLKAQKMCSGRRRRKVYGVSLQSSLQIFWLLFLSLLRLFQ